MQTKLRQGLGLDALGPWHYKGLTSKNLIKVKTKEATKKCHGSKKHITQDAGWLPEGEGMQGGGGENDSFVVGVSLQIAEKFNDL